MPYRCLAVAVVLAFATPSAAEAPEPAAGQWQPVRVVAESSLQGTLRSPRDVRWIEPATLWIADASEGLVSVPVDTPARSAAAESDDEELAVSSEGGSLAIVAAEASGRPQILTADGWDLSVLLSWLGSPPRLSPSSPLTVGGLPPATFTVALGDRREAATVEAGEIVTIELDD
jgi:hypothetical protein